MLAEGEIPAMLSPDIPRLFREGDKRIVRLFPNYKDIEIEFFKQTGIFPIMHVTVIRQEIVGKYPWVATNLVKAFDEAKALAYRRIANPRMCRSPGSGPPGRSSWTFWAPILGLRPRRRQPQQPRNGAALLPSAGLDRPHRCRSTNCSPTPISAMLPAARRTFKLLLARGFGGTKSAFRIAVPGRHQG